MPDLASQHCIVLSPADLPLANHEANHYLAQLSGWRKDSDKTLYREFKFTDFHATMDFVNTVAAIAHQCDHHPDMEIGYNYCRIRFTTHVINGLSLNDFICAAKINNLPTKSST